MKALFLILMACSLASAGLITNPGFEAGFANWTRMDQTGSDGTFLIQTGTSSPINGLPVPGPPQGTSAAMTDAQGPGSHVLYQDFLVPLLVPDALLTFSYALNNTAPQYAFPLTLDFSIATFNQQARVDIMTTGANVFGVGASDVLLNVFQTNASTPLVTAGYVNVQANITSLLQSHAGETLRLRFAEVDNLSFFNFGVDGADIVISDIPEPSTGLLSMAALAGLGWLSRKARRQR